MIDHGLRLSALPIARGQPWRKERKQHIESMGLTNTNNKEQFMGK
jgi:hypothetical protein